ncbi:hypothetical protein L1D55_27220 [Vibrio sp. Isolate22]|uniref:hypothetical protein n=1 Tax=Vibrio TaxID=662 RepID=UPI00104EFD24|nr:MULTISPECIES: hypothetical protein [Vibrio]MCG9695310.1 hypothetical protein [Vibrio sp. Isolate22]TCW18685.1 hypothetical protein EDB48_107227 [Vibrio crassostreae]
MLSHDWSLNAEKRRKDREENGLSINEAQSSLGMYRTSVYPIATEVADFIFSNWGARMVARLDKESRKILFEIFDSEFNTDSETILVRIRDIPFELGTKLRWKSNPNVSAEINSEGIFLNGKVFTSFSRAGTEITKNSVNGWKTWEYYCNESSCWFSVNRRRKEYVDKISTDVLTRINPTN